MSGWLMALSIAITLMSVPGTWVQVAHVLRKRTTAGLSVSTHVLWVWSSGIWAFYGVSTGSDVLLWTNLSSLVGCAIIVGAAAVFGRANLLPWYAATIAFAGVTGLAQALGFDAAVATAAALITIVSRVPQVYRSWRTPEGAGVNLFNFASAGVCSVLWVLYAVAVTDWFLAATSVYCLAFSIFVVGRTFYGRRLIEISRFERELEAALLYERHRHEDRRLGSPIDVVEVSVRP